MSNPLNDPLNDMDMVESLHGMANLARLMRGYYESLIGEGFNAEQALTLTDGLQRGLGSGKADQ